MRYAIGAKSHPTLWQMGITPDLGVTFLHPQDCAIDTWTPPAHRGADGSMRLTGRHPVPNRHPLPRRRPTMLAHRRISLLLAIALPFLSASVSGCCSGLRCPRCPRIDPSGERIFIWPHKDTRVAPASVAATPAIPEVPALGNIQAPPVYADTVGPTVVPNPAAAAVGSSTFTTSSASQTLPASTSVAAPPEDRFLITPEQVLAPVGSEVVLRAGICVREGHLQRVYGMV